MNLGSINVKVGVDTRDLQAGMTGARQAVNAWAREVQISEQHLAALTVQMQREEAAQSRETGAKRQALLLERELSQAKSQLAAVLAEESAAAQSVAVKYDLLTAAERAQLVTVKEQIVAQRALQEALLQSSLAAEKAAATQAEAAAAAKAGRGIAGGAFAGLGLYAAGGLAVGIGAAVHASIEFNREMANVGSLIPGNVARLGELKEAVQQLAIETGKDTKEVATGAYQIISSFGDSAESAKLLAINTRLAIGGVADVGKTIGLTAAVTKTFGDHSAEAVQHVADLAAMTVRLGHTTLPELNASIGQVAPLASQLGVSLDELFGTLATGSGVTGNMGRVATQLRGIFASFANPTKTMVELFNRVGVSSGEALIAQRGFAGAVKLVVDEAERTDTPLQKYFHRIEATTLALPLAGAQAKSLADKIDAMAHSAGAAEKAFQAQQTGIAALGTEWAKLGQTLKVTAQTFGDLIAPALTTAVGTINTYIQAVGKAGAATARFLHPPAAQANQQLDNAVKGYYTGIVDATRSDYLNSLLGPKGPTGYPVGSGGPPVPAAARAAAPAPTKEQLDAHKKIIDQLNSAKFDTARQQAVQYFGELSKQVASLDLFGKAWDKLTGTQQKYALQLLTSEKAEQQSKDAVKAHADALTAAEKARQKAIDDRRKAEEKAERERKAAHDRYREALQAVQAETRDITDYTGMNAIRRQHPGETPKAQKALYDAQQWRDYVKARNESSEAAKREENAINLSMAAKLKEAQIDANAAFAQRKYGEINRETLALQSEWAKSYLELAPAQQRVIDGLYQLALAKQLNADQDKAFVDDAKRRIQAYDDEQKAIDRQINANIDLDKVLAERRRQAEKPKEDAFNEGLKRYSDQLKEEAERRHQQLNDIAEQTSGIFESAFHDAYENGPAQFFRSVVQGVERMFQDIAARYLASQLTNLIFGAPNAQTGDRSTSGVAGQVGSFLGGMAGGGRGMGGGGGLQDLLPLIFGGGGGGSSISASSLQNMFSLQSASRGGGEMYLPPSGGGRATTQAASRGGGHVTVNLHVSTPDVAGFRQNSKALIQDAYRQGQMAQRRNG